MEIKHILKVRDILYTICPLMTSDTENILISVENQSGTLERIKNEVKTIFGVDIPINHFPNVLSVQSLLRMIRTSSDITLNNTTRVPLEKKIDSSADLLEPCQMAEKDNFELGVIAAACRLPGGIRNTSDFWKFLVEGRNANKRIPLNRIPTRDDLIRGIKYGTPVEGGNFIDDTDVFQFDHSLFRISRSEAEWIDPQQRLLLECVYECLENAGILPDLFVRKSNNNNKGESTQIRSKEAIGVFVGLMETEYPHLMKEEEQTGVLSMLGSMTSVLAGRISYAFGCTGPTLTVDTACSSSLMAVELARQSLKEKKCTKAIVAGVNLILTETALGHRANGKMLSEHGMSYSFDARASGYGRADGCSVVLLEEAHKSYPYMGIIEKINSNHCGRGVSLTAPNPEAHDELISGLFGNDLQPHDISYWEAHGTGTPLGDPIEINVLAKKLGETTIGSVKSSVGHGEAAAGTTSLIKVLLMLKNDYIPPSLHFHVLNKQINPGDLTIPVVGEEKKLTRCGISSFGVSGTNVAMIIRKAENYQCAREMSVDKYCLLMISGKTSLSLDRISEKVQNRIEENDTSLRALASTLCHRPHFDNFRLALIYNCDGEQLESFRIDRRDDDWDLSFIHISHELCPDILQIAKINAHFLNQPQPRSREAKLKLALFEFLNEFSPEAEIRVMSPRDYVYLLVHQKKLNFSEKLLEDLEWTVTIEEVTHVLKDHRMNAIVFPPSFDIDPEERCALPITNLRTLLRVFAFSYSHGKNHNYKIIYEEAQNRINGLNYCFDKKDSWFRKRKDLFDHQLIGKRVTENDKLTIYENQLSALRHPQLFLRNSDADILQSNFSAAIEMICTSVEGLIETPVHIWDLKVAQMPAQSDKEFLRISVNKNTEDAGYQITATIGPHFFFSCNGANREKNQKVREKIELAGDARTFKREQDCPYRVMCSQFWHMDNNLSSVELFLYKPLTTDFEIKKIHSNIGIAVVTQEDLLLEMFSTRQSMTDNGKVPSSEKPSTGEKENFTRAGNLREDIRNVIIEALNDVVPDGLEDDMTNSVTGFMELGLDSLSLIEFVNRLNSNSLLTYEVSTSDVFDFPSIDSLNDFLFQNIYRNDTGTSGTEKDEKVFESDKSPVHSKEKEDMLKILLQALDDVLMEPLSNVDVRSGFMQLGLDSIALVDFINRLNDRYLPNLNLTTSHLFEFVNLDELTDFIVSKNQEGQGNIMPKPSDFRLAQEVKPPDDHDSERVLYKMQEIFMNQTPHCTITLDSGEPRSTEHPSVSFNKVIDLLPENPFLDIDIERNLMTDSDIFGKLCTFGQTLIRMKKKVQLTVQKTSKIENQIAISFFKTLSAEQHPNIVFIWPDRISRYCSEKKNCEPLKGSWLLTGGLSGIGWACAEWLASFEEVVEIHLISRRRSPDKAIATRIETLKQQGTDICFHRADVSDYAQVLEVFRKLRSPLNGVIHSAGILRDCRIERQSQQLFEDVYKPKVGGFMVLDSLLTEFGMSSATLVVMSSFTAVCGNIGQSNYGVVNTIMEQKVRERRRKGHLRTMAITWGNWREIGMASDPNLIQHLDGIGLPGLTTKQALNCMQIAINSEEESLVVAKIDFNKLLKKRKDMPPNLLISNQPLEEAVYNMPIIALNIFYDEVDSFERSKEQSLLRFTRPTSIVNSGRFVEEVFAKSREEFYDKMNQLTCSLKERIPLHRIVWLFPGQGSQYVGMSRELSAIFPAFRHQFSNNLKNAQCYFEQDLTKVLTTPEKAHYLEKTSYGQPLLVCFCHALYVLWKSVGLAMPDYLLGHSVGELVAGVIAQMLTFEQALSIAVSRGKAMEKSRNRGALLAVNIPDVYELISRHDIHVSAWNSNSQTVLAGELGKLEEISLEIKSQGGKATFINDSYPFHSPLIHNDDLEEFKLLLDSLEFPHSETGIISCITGETLHKFSTSYLISHVSQPVNFSKCIEKLKNYNVNIWLELGPSQLLSSLIQKTLMSEDVADQHLVRSTCSGKSCDIENFVKTALDLEKAGVFISWNNIFLNNYANKDEERLITWPIVETHTISDEEEQVLKCHIVRDEVIIPAAFQLTKIYEWISYLISCSETIELTNIKFFSPWKLTCGKHFNTTLTSSNQVILEVRGQRITTCQIQYKEKRNRLIDINIWKEQCKEELDIKNYYKQQAVNGTEYGHYFQLLHSMKIGGNKIIARAHSKSKDVWPLIDSSFHSVCPLMLTRRADLIFIPAAISSIDMIVSDYNLDQCEIWILSEIMEYNEKFIRVNSCVTLRSHGSDDYEIIFQGTNEMSVMESAPISNNIVTSTTTSQYTNDCSSVQSESWPTDEHDDLTGSIGIIGYDCMFCHDASNPEALWNKLISHDVTNDYKYEKRTPETSPSYSKGVGLIDTAVHQWDPEFFGISPREAPFVDVSQRLLLKIVWRCMERTGLAEFPKRTAVLVGLSGCDFEQLAFAETIRNNSDKPNGFFTTGIHRSCAAGRLAHFLGTEGPAITLDTACSSSMAGIWLAYEMLASRRCDMAIIAAVNVILTDHVTNSLQNAGMLSNDADPNCKAFDASANGYKRSEGVACIILTKESFLVNSVIPSEISMLAKIACCNLGHNGTASALHVPNGRSQLRVMSVDGTRVIHTEHVECHGSGTALGDVIECRAIASELQKDDNVTISSIKSFLGHTESASGLASLITALMQIQHGYRLHQPHISLVNRQLDCNHLLVNFVGQEANIERIRVNNFGFSGTIGSFILEKNDRVRHFDDGCSAQYYQLAVLSAKSPKSLKSYSKSFFKFLKETAAPLEQICAKLQRGRSHHRYRRCVLMNFRAEILWDSDDETKLSTTDSGKESWEGLNDPELISFCFSSSLPIHLRNNKLTLEATNEFLTELGCDRIRKLSPLLFHQAIGRAYVRGKNIKWKNFNGQLCDFSTIGLPSYEFDERPFWPFTKGCIKNLCYKRKRIAFSRKLILKNDRRNKETDQQAAYIISTSSSMVDLPSIDMKEISECRESKLVFEVEDSSIQSAMKLIELWNVLEIDRKNTLFVIVRSNRTKYTEWTGILKSLASEKPHPYSFISFEHLAEVRNELDYPDVYEAVFYENNQRFVERLIEVENDHYTPPYTPKSLLLSGSEGGLGKEIQKNLKPASITKVSRRLGQNVASFTNLTDEFDLICHCAGSVKNSPLQKMKEEDFCGIWEAKIEGFKNLETISTVHKCPIILFSSIASILGSAGQTNYSFINGLMTSLAEKSKCTTNTLHLGPCLDVGMLSGAGMARIREGIQRRGWNFLEAQDILDQIITEEKEIILFDGNFDEIIQKQPHLRPLLENFVPKTDAPIAKKNLDLVQIVQQVSGLVDLSNDLDTPFMKFGIDSLMMEEIRQLIRENFKTSLKLSDLYDNSTLNKMEKFLSSKVFETEAKVEAVPLEIQNIESNGIAIIGLSGSFSNSEDVEDFWKNLFKDSDCITRSKNSKSSHILASGILPNLECFDHNFFKMSSEEASRYDPQLRQFVQHAYKALDESGYAVDRQSRRIAVFAGGEPNEYGRGTEAAEGSLMELFYMNQKDFTAVLTSHLLDLTGPSLGVYSACSSSLTALNMAMNSLAMKEADLAIVGSASLIINKDRGYEYEEGNVLSRSGYCRPFEDKLADGIVRGSSVGCLVLKRLAEAQTDGDHIWAAIKSININNDGYDKASFLAPSSIGQTKCIRGAMDKLEQRLLSRVSYIECHGTATRVGDEIELSALQQTYGNLNSCIQIGSVKSNIGHGFAAAGIASIIKCLKMLQTRRIPPQCHLKEDRLLGDENQFLLSKTEKKLKPESLIGVSSFGIGGTNGHLILESVPHNINLLSSSGVHILPVSGRSEYSVRKLCEKLANYLEEHTENEDLGSIAFTLQNRREHHPYRVAVTASSVREAVHQFRRADLKIRKAIDLCADNIAYFFCPQGVLYPGIEKSSARDLPVFSKTLRELCEQATSLGSSDYQEMLACDSEKRLNQTKYGQVANLILNLSIIKQLNSWSVQGNTVLGHSIGEYAAACIANTLKESDCLQILKARGELCHRTPEACMLTIRNLDSSLLLSNVEVSAILSESLKCVVGKPDIIENLKQSFVQTAVDFKELKTDKGFHSSMMNDIVNDFRGVLNTFKYNSVPVKKFISSMNGEVTTSLNVQYWVEHLRNPVRLDKSLQTLMRDSKIKVVIEIGPSGILEVLLGELNPGISVVQTVPSKKQSEHSTVSSQMIQSLADLWAYGYKVNFAQVFQNTRKRSCYLPTYEFDLIPCWNEIPEKVNRFGFYKTVFAPISGKVRESSEVDERRLTIIVEETSQIKELEECFRINSKIFITEEVLKMNRFISDVIVYMPGKKNLLEPFFVVKHLHEIVKGKYKLLIISDENQVHHGTCIGPIREGILNGHETTKFVVNRENLELSRILRSLPYTEEHVLFMTSSRTFSMEFTEDLDTRKQLREDDIGKTVLVLGGTGTIGQKYVEELLELSFIRRVVVCSRQQTHCNSERVVYAKVDLLNKESIDDLMSTYWQEIDSIVHVAGQTTSSELSKSIDDMNDVLRTKVFSTDCILEYLRTKGKRIKKLILVSSLSSSLVIQGNDDYVSANIYFDFLSLYGCAEVVDSISSIQFPPVRSSKMHSDYNGPFKQYFNQSVINLKTVSEVIKYSFTAQSCCSFSPLNPTKLRRLLIEKQINSFAIPESSQSEEETARTIWQRILSVSSIDDSSNFFELGGNSLSAMQLIWKINQSLNINVSSRKLFENPTFGKFFEEIRVSHKKAPQYPTLNAIHYEVPLLPSQEHMYFLHEMSQETEYNLIFCVNFRTSEKVNIKYLRYSLNSLIAQQRSYRTFFRRSGPSLTQMSLSLTECYMNLEKRKLSLPEQADFIDQEKKFKFTLQAQHPALHISFLSTDSQLKILFNQAHILTDGWSMTVLASNLEKLYMGYQDSEPITQAQCTLAQYALEHSRTKTVSPEGYKAWIEELEASTPTQFPTNLVVPEGGHKKFSRIRRLVPDRIWRKVQSLARKYQTTEFVVVLTSYLLAVRKYKADPCNDQIMIGCPVSGRNEGNESLIGYFLNNMIINVELPHLETTEAIKVVEKSLSKSKEFEDAPYHRLISDIRANRNNIKNLFHLYFNFRHSLEYPKFNIAGVSPTIEQISINSIFDLSTTVDEKPNGTEILLEFDTSKYSMDEMNMFINDILKHLSTKPHHEELTLPISRADFPQTSISQAIVHQLGSTDWKTNEKAINLQSVHNLSLGLSESFLIRMGRTIRPDDFIPIDFDRNESVEYILAILLTGAGYVPIDKSWPEERKTRILQNTHCDLTIESKEHSLKRRKKTVLQNRNHSLDVTYVIHTSGSTANPKGVVIEHQNVMSFVTSAIRQILVNPSSVVLNSVNTVFDVSVSNIFTSLFANSTLVYQENSMSFLEDIQKHNCSHCFLPSAVFNQIPSNQLKQLQCLDMLTIGGESINDHKLHKVLKLDLDVLQIYGPTETTVWSLTNRCKFGRNCGILIGQPNPNEVCQISSNRSVYGELVISGPSVARGYLLDGKNCQSFKGQYHTSDLVFEWENKFYFYGRMDDQTKIRGQLVNLRHIEEALMAISSLDFVHITLIKGQLIAFVPEHGKTSKEMLASRLPSYMVPSHFIEVPSLILNTSGKVDRRKLLETFENFKSNREKNVSKAEFMRSWIELMVREIFQELTGDGEFFEEDEDFFTLGGHSLLLMELQTRIEDTFKIKIEISQIYEALTIKQLSKLIGSLYFVACADRTLVHITTIRENAGDRMNVYFVHAVGGSILPYYAFLDILPSNKYNLYAIEYQLDYEAQTLKELSAAYAISISQIVMFDTWAIDHQRLSIEKVKAFAMKVFMNMPDSEKRVQKAVILAKMLKRHKNTVSYTDIKLFKAQDLGDASFRLAVRNELDEMGARSMIANGLEQYCLGKFHTYMLPGDHESCMKLHNLKQRKQEIQDIFEDLPVWK